MSERYSRLFTLSENLYAVGSPVVIAAGTLLKDNQTGKIIAQLKLKSISTRAINAVKVKLDLFDTAGNALEECVVHDYLDLNVARDVEFGQKNPVMVPNVKARSYKASVTEVVFADRSVWTGEVEYWEPLSSPSRLAFGDPELQKQYELEFGINSTYEPKIVKDLWYCTCGTLNRKEESGCHYCHNFLNDLQKIDIAAMKQRRDERIAQEQKDAAEAACKQEEKRSAMKRKALLIGIPLAIAVLVFLLVTKVILPSVNYNKAAVLLEQRNYAAASAMFEKLGNYKDASKMVLEVAYQEAESLMEAKKYEDAIPVFRSLNDYKDSASKLSTCKNTVDYEKAMNAFSNEDYNTAIPLLKRLGEYQDSEKKLEDCYIAIHGEDIYRKISSLKVGDQVELGRFEQDNDSETTDEPIVWNVIAADKNAFLLLSDKILTYRRYHGEYSYVGQWEQTKSFEWLNIHFYDSAFNKEERKTILLNNPSCTANVFLLSSEEAANLTSSIRKAESTKYAYAVNRGTVLNGELGYWALRTIVDIESPTIGGKHYLTVNKWGDPPIGFRIREEENKYEIGKHGLNCDNPSTTGIRPAIWVSLDAYK